MAPWVCRAALQRSVGKIFYLAGFEDFQPAALDVMTDVASDFFTKLVSSFNAYREMPRSRGSDRPKFTGEEQLLHALHENGLDLDSMDSYIKEDMDRFGTKLGVVHERLRSHFADIFVSDFLHRSRISADINFQRPALGDNAGADGVGAFNDGSEQFVGGDFAEDIDEDFFGFRELGLLEEFGIETMSVPLHLLQARLQNAHNPNQPVITDPAHQVFPKPEAYEPVSAENVTGLIGLVKDFFSNRLVANNGRPLVEDEDLPLKQKFPKPRLGPQGKISSPRKRPIREQQQAAKKKRKMEEAAREGGGGGAEKKLKEIRPLKLEMPEVRLGNETGDPDKDGAGAVLLSPESIVAA